MGSRSLPSLDHQDLGEVASECASACVLPFLCRRCTGLCWRLGGTAWKLGGGGQRGQRGWNEVRLLPAAACCRLLPTQRRCSLAQHGPACAHWVRLPSTSTIPAPALPPTRPAPSGWTPRQQQVMSNLLRIRAVAQQCLLRQVRWAAAGGRSTGRRRARVPHAACLGLEAASSAVLAGLHRTRSARCGHCPPLAC